MDVSRYMCLLTYKFLCNVFVVLCTSKNNNLKLHIRPPLNARAPVMLPAYFWANKRTHHKKRREYHASVANAPRMGNKEISNAAKRQSISRVLLEMPEEKMEKWKNVVRGKNGKKWPTKTRTRMNETRNVHERSDKRRRNKA